MKSDISLQQFNTLAIPAKARWFTELDSLEQLHNINEFVLEKACPVLVLGEGSNIVLADDFNGLVVLNKLLGKQNVEQSSNELTIKVNAGENWHEFVKWSLEEGWQGLQNLALIPGTVGAAPIQNIGAYGVELNDVFVSLEAYEIATGKTHSFDRKQCEFAYRDSVFKNDWRDKLCITSVTFQLNKNKVSASKYPALMGYLSERNIESPTPKDVFDAVCAIRQSKLPNPAVLPNAGSFFKNPIVSKALYESLLTQYPEIVAYPAGAEMKLAAGWLIEKAGWKGKEIEGVETHKLQALVLTNPNECSGKLVLNYAKQLQAVIKQRFDVVLEIEPRIYS